MQYPIPNHTGIITESIRGIVDRVTYHNPDNGWSILPFNSPAFQNVVSESYIHGSNKGKAHGCFGGYPEGVGYGGQKTRHITKTDILERAFAGIIGVPDYYELLTLSIIPIREDLLRFPKRKIP